MSATIDSLHTEFFDLLVYLEEQGEVSWRTVVDANFRKILLIAVASHFERSLQNTVLTFATHVIGAEHPLFHLVRNKAIHRQYHTWFNWEDRNANSFFGLFGETFKKHMRDRVQNEDELDSSIKDFLEIGRERNRLVHDDYADFTMEKTSEEIYRLYGSAKLFVERFPGYLQTFAGENTAT